MHLLYLTFGNQQEIHSQAVFSICSFLQAGSQVSTVNIITDQPARYQLLQSSVNIIGITTAELQEWEGKYRFFWRVKIKAIEKICALYPGEPVVYVDTDTFLNGDPAFLSTCLQQGTALMHVNEGPLAAKTSKTEKKMWCQIKEKQYGGLTMQATDCMWNAGVVATPNTSWCRDMELALAICDEMCRQEVTRRLIEQYALSLALAHLYGLQEAQEQIIHYWTVKPVWNRQINDFLVGAFLSGQSFSQLVEAFDLSVFTAIPVFQQNRNTNQRLKTWVDRFFPSTRQTYFRKHN